MSDYGIWYTTRERVVSAIDIGMPMSDRLRIDEAIEGSARAIENTYNRRFYPELRTLGLDWPSRTFGRSWRVWLPPWDEFQSVTTLTSGGTEISSDDYILYPRNGPPYNRVEVNIGTSAAFSSGSSPQNSLQIYGLGGWSDNNPSAGSTASSLTSSTTSVDVTDSSRIGVGTVLKISSERMVVTDRSWLTTGQTGSLTASKASVTLAVSDGTTFFKNEILLLDSEYVYVNDIVGNNLIVRRAIYGSVLADHSGSTIYAPRRLTVRRAVLGTTASSHSSPATVLRWEPPRLAESLNVAEAVALFLAENSGYARTVGSGESERELRGNSLTDLRLQADQVYGRHIAHRAV